MGPSATQMLADFGADVVKIENPRGGDLSRTAFGATDEAGLEQSGFLQPEPQQTLAGSGSCGRMSNKSNRARADSSDSDVVVSNFRAGVMDRIGFGYEKCRELNPKSCVRQRQWLRSQRSLRPQGWPGCACAQAMSGVMMRRADASVPMSIYPTALCDYTAGMHLVQAVLAALIGVSRTGEGQQR